MCIFCDGGTLDDLCIRLHLQIARHGFTLIGVESGSARTSWAYTVGLSEHDEHPELVLRGRDPADACPVLVELGGQVLSGRTLHAGALGTTAAGPCTFREVPAKDLRDGIVQGWTSYYGALGSGPSLRALDVCLLPRFGCSPGPMEGRAGAADPWAPLS